MVLEGAMFFTELQQGLMTFMDLQLCCATGIVLNIQQEEDVCRPLSQRDLLSLPPVSPPYEKALQDGRVQKDGVPAGTDASVVSWPDSSLSDTDVMLVLLH